MNNLQDRLHLPNPNEILDKLKGYSRKAGDLGHRVRERVFGFRLRSTVDIDRWSLPAKLHRHRILQRRRAFYRAGGGHSSLAKYALKKARHSRQQP